jgi:hypothetical protein
MRSQAPSSTLLPNRSVAGSSHSTSSHSQLTFVSSSSYSTLASPSPDPYFPNQNNFEISYERAPNGVLTGMWVRTNVINRGGAGDVFTQLHPDYVTANATHSLVFFMDSGETVIFSCYFSGNTGSGIAQFYWTVRAALQDDVSKGTTTVTRSASIPGFSTSAPILFVASLAIASLALVRFILNRKIPTRHTSK